MTETSTRRLTEHDWSFIPTGERPEIPRLAPETFEEVQALDAGISVALKNITSSAALEAAIEAADRMAHIRQHHQGSTWWETVNAQQLARALRDLYALAVNKREELVLVWRGQDELFELRSEGKFADAVAGYQAMVEVESSLLGDDNPWLVTSLTHLAGVQSEAGLTEEAEATGRRALEVNLRTFGEKNPRTAADLEFIAGLCWRSDRKDEAEWLLLRAAVCREATLGADSLVHLNTLSSLAECHWSRNDLIEHMLRRALPAVEKNLPADSPWLIGLLADLVRVTPFTASFQERATLYQRAAALLDQRADKPSGVLERFASIFEDDRRYAYAEWFLTQAESQRMASAESDPEAYDRTVNRLIECCRQTRRMEKALACVLRWLGHRRGALKPAELLSGLYNVAKIAREADRTEVAEAHWREARPLAVELFGPGSYAHLRVLDGLIELCESGSYDQHSLEQGIAALQELLGTDPLRSAPSLERARRLEQLAGFHDRLGDFGKAEELFGEGLRDRHAIASDPEHPDHDAALESWTRYRIDRAERLQQRGRFTEAEALFNELVSEERHGTHIARRLAKLLVEMRRYSDAEKEWTNIVSLEKQSYFGDSGRSRSVWWYLSAVTGLGHCRLEQGGSGLAADTFRQAYSLLVQDKKAKDDNALAELREGAISQEETTRQLKEGLDPRELRHVLYGLLKVTTPEECLPIIEEMEREAVARRDIDPLEDAADHYEQLKLKDRAVAARRTVWSIARERYGPDHVTTASAAHALGFRLMLVKELTEAREFLEQAVSVTRVTLGLAHESYQQYAMHLVDCLCQLQRADEAGKILEELLSALRESCGEGTPRYLSRVADIVNSLWLARQVNACASLAVEVAAAARIAFSDEHPSFLSAISSAAFCLLEAGRHGEALPLLLESSQQSVVAARRRLPGASEQERDSIVNSATGAGAIMETLVFQLAGFEELPASTRSRCLEEAIRRRDFIYDFNRREASALNELVEKAPHEWRSGYRRLQQLRASYAQVALGTSSERVTEALSDLYVAISSLETRLRQSSEDYATLTASPRLDIADVIGNLRRGECLVQYAKYPYRDLRNRDWQWDDPTWRYGAFIVCGDGRGVLIAELGSAGDIESLVKKHERVLREAIQKLTTTRGDLAAALLASEELVGEVSRELRVAIWEPIVRLCGDAPRMYIAPDGVLSLVSFESLAAPDADGHWRYVVEDVELVYLSNGGDLARLTRQPAAADRKDAVIVANPAFDADRRELAAVIRNRKKPQLTTQPSEIISHDVIVDVATLSAALPRNWRQEGTLEAFARALAQKLATEGWSVTSLLGTCATEEIVLGLQAPRLVQFATHGHMVRLPELGDDKDARVQRLTRSMLILAGANKPWERDASTFYSVGDRMLREREAIAEGLNKEALGDRIEVGDGLLTAYEVTGIDLRGTELVNLTACETGLGEVTPHGVAGLRQAFLTAGARSITMSMWTVPVRETIEHIDEFLDRWLASGPACRYRSFREAQLAVLARTRHRYRSGHPFLWAGSSYVGDPGDLPGASVWTS